MDNYFSYESRDMRCASDVGRMAVLGRFEKEFPSYGCAYKKDGKIFFRISGNQDEIQDFFMQSIHKAIYPTLIVNDIFRSVVPAGMEEQIRHECNYKMARRFKEWYPKAFFEAFSDLAETPSNDAATELLTDWLKDIQYHFDLFELQNYIGVVEHAYQAKKLTARSYNYINACVEKIARQFDDDPVLTERFERTLYGFIERQPSGNTLLHFDAQRAKVIARYIDAVYSGNVVAPVLEETVTFHDFDSFPDLRRAFRERVKSRQNEACFCILDRLRKLPSPIDDRAFARFMAQELSEPCRNTLTYYGKVWHLL